MQIRFPFGASPRLGTLLTFIRRFLAPPVFADEDKTFVAGMFNNILLASIGVGLLGVIALVLLGVANPYNVVISLVTYAVLLGLREGMRRGSVRLTIVLALTVVVLANSVIIFNSGTIRTLSLGVYLLGILASTIWVGPRVGFVFTFLSVAIVFGLAQAELAGRLPVMPAPTILDQWVTFSGLTIITFAFVMVLRRTMLGSLRQARGDLTQRQQVEEALRANQAQLSGIIDSAMDAIITIDETQHITLFNRAAEEMFRCSATEAIGQPLDRFIPENFRSSHAEHVRRFGLAGTTRRAMGALGVLSGLRASGEIFPIEASISQVTPNGQKIFTVILRDITERRRMEAALRNSETHYRAIVEDQTDLICRYRPDGTLTFVNPAYCRYFGKTAEASLGSNFELRVHAEDQDIVARKRDTLSPQHPVTAYWCRVYMSNEDIRWQEWTERALYDEDDHLSEFQVVGHDITERQKAMEATKQHNKELLTINTIATLLNQASDLESRLQAVLGKVVEILRAERGWVYLLEENQDSAWLTLIAQHGSGKFDLSQIVNLDAISMLESNATALQMVQQVSEGVQTHLKLSGEEMSFDVEGAPLWAKEKALGVLGILKSSAAAINESEQQLLSTIGHQVGVMIENMQLSEKAAENEILRKLDRLRSELVANVSHELRTPLGLITLACTSLLEEDVVFDRKTQREFLRDIEAEASKLEKIVDNLLDLSRMQSGRMRLEKHLTNLRQLSQESVRAMQLQFMQHRFVTDFPASPHVVMADAKRIEQVLRNLLGNAGKYSPPETCITIQGGLRGNEVLIAVSDQGSGIPAQDLEKVFERFYRVKREGELEAPGIGLGLAVCRGIIEAHGGRIWVESTLGKGSTFYFTLPTTLGEAEMDSSS